MKKRKITIRTCRKATGFGLWFGYKFTNLGYSTKFCQNIQLNTKEYIRLFSFYFPFYIFEVCLSTTIFLEQVCDYCEGDGMSDGLQGQHPMCYKCNGEGKIYTN